MSYGKELIIDIHKCQIEVFTRVQIEMYFTLLCDRINMKREDLHFWDYEGDQEGYDEAPAHLKGISAVQFISTSNITVHTLDDLKTVYINVFSCKDFDEKEVLVLSSKFFNGKIVNVQRVTRH